jgi:hypothetical protein
MSLVAIIWYTLAAFYTASGWSYIGTEELLSGYPT